MKKIINKPESLVSEMCRGLVYSNTELKFNAKYKFISKRSMNKNKVTLISGGGSGHEPAHAGLIGKGMLDVAVCGEVFASPSQIQVYRAIKECAGDKGVLLIIKNYSGDVMNFKSAARMALEDGIDVDSVNVNDDIAVKDSLYTVGRRGVAGTVFVHKIAGAAAQNGLELSDVRRIAEKTVDNVKSIGFALSACTVPATGTPSFTLEGDEIEFGIGIHGEPGIKKEPIQPAEVLAQRAVSALCEELDLKGGGDEKVVVLINGFGATPLMELYVLNYEVAKILADRNIQISRSLVGEYMTSIDMAGASISILKLDDELEKYMNEPCQTPALNIYGPAEPFEYTDYLELNRVSAEDAVDLPQSYGVVGDGGVTLENMMFIVNVMCESAIKHEEVFCAVDAYAGDGDFGTSVAKGFKELKKQWPQIVSKKELDMSGFLHEVSLVIMEHCGGASGPIWGAAFRQAARAIESKQVLGVDDFADMLEACVKGIQSIGEWAFGRGAVVGDKTLIDALVPAAEAWRKNAQDGGGFQKAFKDGAEAAVQGAKETEKIVARVGRAGVVGGRSLGYQDAGAYGIGVIFTDIAGSIK